MTDISPTLRQDNETLEQYKQRLVLNKERYGLYWSDIAQLWFEHTGERKSDDYFRKYRKRLNKNTNPVNQSVSSEIEDRLIQIEKEKYKIQDQKREYRNLIRQEARFEHLREEIIKAVRDVAKLKPLQWNQPLPYRTSKREGVLLLSDWHYGIVSDNYWNKFNTNIFFERIKKLTEKTIEYGKEQGIKTLHVMCLGDMISGLIHVSVRVQQTEDAISQVKIVSETLCEMLAKLASEFEEVKFYSCRGNHDRVTPSKNEHISKESFADIIPWYMKPRLQPIKNVEIIDNQYDDEIIVANVCGHTVFGVHGHKDKVSEVAANLSNMLRIYPTTIVMGHYHHNWEKEFAGVDIVVNSSLSGVDEYARDIRKISKPLQKFLVYSNEGQIATYKILL